MSDIKVLANQLPDIDKQTIASHLEGIANELSIDATSNNIGLFAYQTANEAIQQALLQPNPLYLYDVLIQEGEVIILFADTGVGKTIYAMQSAIHIANNGRRVLFLDLELSKKQFQKRYTNDNGIPFTMPENLYRVGYSRLTTVPKDISYSDYFFESLNGLIDTLQPNVIYIDNLTKLSAGDTDSAKASIPILEGLNKIKSEYKITIIAIEHNKKVDTSRPIQLNDLQGSKMKSNLVDSVFTIGRSSRDKNLRYLKQVKVRDGELRYDTDNVLTLEISKDKGYLCFTTIGMESEFNHLKEQSEKDKESINNSILDLHSQGKSYRDIATTLNLSHMKVKRFIDKNKA